MKLIMILFLIGLVFSACSGGNDLSDAYGNFEATEITISAETTGKLIVFNIEEGQTIKEGEIVGVIDTTQLYLKMEQLEASKKAISTKFGSVIAQINVLKEQKVNAEKDQKRIEAMFNSKAATQKQLDDINGNITVINKQINQIETQNGTIINELKSLDAQIAQVDDFLKKSIIVNPVEGTVLNKYAEPYEIAVAGKPLYKIADISIMYLKAYVSGDQLPKIKIGQQVKILIDKNKKELNSLTGTISWISSQSEFTPKIIQTKDERVNMVYAIKVKVKNDGQLKIGMPGEVRF
ncbi:MAG: ABC transporter [Ignavibacteria bacterium GWB2_35_12]|nr:MAG: ABC transporter [Ignavibacteria bacterium GWA2_35_8]OGU42494.1 MAG: ABC transporter [Ignavibacteria bacterium GWB2_35_12]OGU96640.1 MAG: ABC transporter [Ignavibacteria bacterium RIFOXYA2_FULL_35_10]OGV24274.1 MAG: ABC transporter [Ignavibacteria bacterium RIFOXYC2_FULL_35_21]